MFEQQKHTYSLRSFEIQGKSVDLSHIIKAYEGNLLQCYSE